MAIWQCGYVAQQAGNVVVGQQRSGGYVAMWLVAMWLCGHVAIIFNYDNPPTSTYRLPPLHQPPSWGTRWNLGDTSGRVPQVPMILWFSYAHCSWYPWISLDIQGHPILRCPDTHQRFLKSCLFSFVSSSAEAQMLLFA